MLFTLSHTRKRHGGLPALACCLLLILFSGQGRAAGSDACRQEKPLVFGILPLLSAEQLVARFSPLANYLSEQLRMAVYLETAPDFAEFARRTYEDRRYDILYTAPHLYARAHRKAGYRLVASVDSPGMWAVIVTPKDSGIETILDLKGRRLATLQPLSLAAILVRKTLLDAGIDPDVDLELVATPSHDASLLSSYHGVTDAAALMQPPYAAASAEIKQDMRIIARSVTTPHIPISVGPWVAESCAGQITAVLTGMSASPLGRSVLQHIRFGGFKAPDTGEYGHLYELLY